MESLICDTMGLELLAALIQVWPVPDPCVLILTIVLEEHTAAHCIKEGRYFLFVKFFHDFLK